MIISVVSLTDLCWYCHSPSDTVSRFDWYTLLDTGHWSCVTGMHPSELLWSTMGKILQIIMDLCQSTLDLQMQSRRISHVTNIFLCFDLFQWIEKFKLFDVQLQLDLQLLKRFVHWKFLLGNQLTDVLLQKYDMMRVKHNEVWKLEIIKQQYFTVLSPVQVMFPNTKKQYLNTFYNWCSNLLLMFSSLSLLQELFNTSKMEYCFI